MPRRKGVAEESDRTKKTREKLQRRLKEIEEKITPYALQRKLSEIHRWIARNAPSRVALRSKSICLFDENQNAAHLSRKLLIILERLKK